MSSLRYPKSGLQKQSRQPGEDGGGTDVLVYESSGLLKPVLAVHAGALVHVCFGDVGAAAGGDALLDTLADKAAHEEGAALYTPVGFRVPGDPLCIRQGSTLSSSLGYDCILPCKPFEGDRHNNEYPWAPLEYACRPRSPERKVWRERQHFTPRRSHASTRAAGEACRT